MFYSDNFHSCFSPALMFRWDKPSMKHMVWSFFLENVSEVLKTAHCNCMSITLNCYRMHRWCCYCKYVYLFKATYPFMQYSMLLYIDYRSIHILKCNKYFQKGQLKIHLFIFCLLQHTYLPCRSFVMCSPLRKKREKFIFWIYWLCDGSSWFCINWIKYQ